MSTTNPSKPAQRFSRWDTSGDVRRGSCPVRVDQRADLAHYGVDLVIVAIPSIGRDTFVRTVEEAFKANARMSFVPSHFLPSDPWVDYQDIDGVLLASFGKSNATDRL